RRNTPSRVPRYVSTSILSAMLGTRLFRHRVEYTQHAAVAAEEIKAIPFRKKTRLQWWRQDSRLEQSTVNPPALAVDFTKRTRKRRRDGAHEIVNFNGGTGPVDEAVFRAAASK